MVRVKHFALGLALLTATAAHAQAQKVFRCVDARGAVYYTEKPAPGCRPTRIQSGSDVAPEAKPAAAAKANTPDPKSRVRQSAAAPLTAKAHCDGLSREATRLDSGKSSLPSSVADARRAGIQKELERSCR